MKRILLVKLSSMGDIIHNMPMLHDIKQHFPEVQVDWVVEEGFAGLVSLNPLVNKIIPLAMRRWKKALFSQSTWLEFSAFKQNLQGQHYDAILDTQGLLKSALVSRMAYGTSHGQSAKTARERLAGWLYHQAYDNPYTLHAITRNRQMGALALGYALPDSPPVYDFFVEPVALPNDLPERFVMGFHSTARAAKHWPTEYWIQIGQFLAAKNLSFLLPWGSEAEYQRALAIAAPLTNAVVLPKMSLKALSYLISQAQAVVGLDTGLTHIAVALNIPALAIFTDTHLWQAGVMPTLPGRAVTLGGKGKIPAPENVISTLASLLPRALKAEK